MKDKPQPANPTAAKPDEEKQRSPLDGILEDPKATDAGVASGDKALWDSSREKSEIERRSKNP